MNLIEAVKSGKRFRKPNSRGAYGLWYSVSQSGAISDEHGLIGPIFDREDLLSERWEIETTRLLSTEIVDECLEKLTKIQRILEGI